MKKKIYSLLLMLVCVFALSACGEEVKVQKDTSKMNFAPQMVITLVTSPDQPGVIYDYDNSGRIIMRTRRQTEYRTLRQYGYQYNLGQTFIRFRYWK